MRLQDGERWQLVLMLVVTFSTGVVDAVGFLGLDRVFTGNMTGNVVILGMGLAGAQDLPVLGPTLALVGFMGGAAIAGRVLNRRPRGWGRSTTVLLAVTGAGIVASGIMLTLVQGDPSFAVTVATTTWLGTLMGVQACAARHLAVKDVTTVVVTSTLTGLAADSRVAGGSGEHAPRRILAVVLILAGAGVGALLLAWHVSAGLYLAGTILLAVAAVGSIVHRGAERVP